MQLLLHTGVVESFYNGRSDVSEGFLSDWIVRLEDERVLKCLELLAVSWDYGGFVVMSKYTLTSS